MLVENVQRNTVKYTWECCKSIRHVQWFMEYTHHTHSTYRCMYADPHSKPKEWIYNNKYLVNFRLYSINRHAFVSYRCFEELDWKPHDLPISFSRFRIRFPNSMHTACVDIELLATIPMHLSAIRIEMRWMENNRNNNSNNHNNDKNNAYEIDELFHEVFVHKLKIHL